MFGTFGARLGPMLLGAEPPAAAVELSGRLRAAWTAFATRGDPGWPRFDAERGLVHVFDSPSKVVTYPEDASRRIWQNHAFDPLPLLGGDAGRA